MSREPKIKLTLDESMPILVLLITIVLYKFIFKDLLKLADQESYNENVLTVTSTLIGTLFTVFGLFLALPDTSFMKLMKEHGQFRKMNNILIIGLLTSFVTMILSLTNICVTVKEYLFVASIIETIYAAIYLYRITMYNSKSSKKDENN